MEGNEGAAQTTSLGGGENSGEPKTLEKDPQVEDEKEPTEGGNGADLSAAKEKEKVPEKKPDQPVKKKLKVDGKELELPEDEVVRLAQKGIAADKRFHEAAMLKKQATEVLQMLNNDQQFFEVAKRLGKDPRQLAEQYLVELIKEEQMSPSEREILKLKRELAQKAEFEEQVKQEKINQAKEAMRQKYSKEMQDDILGILEKSGLPKTPQTVQRFAYHMKLQMKMGMEPSAYDVLSKVRDDYRNDLQALLSASEGDDLINYVGESTADKIRKYYLSKVQNPQDRNSVKSGQTVQIPKPKGQHFITEKDLRAHLKKIKAQG